jgi:glycosyltransferase involved in cell wall biosynthesis
MTERSPVPRELKVLYCILDNRFGGPHRRAHAAALQLRRDNVETLFLLGHKAGGTWQPEGFPLFVCRHMQCFRRRGPLVGLARFLAMLPWNLRRIRRILRANDIDIVHVDGVTNFVPALAAALTRTPIVWHYNDHLVGPLKWLLVPLLRRLAAVVVVQGESLRRSRTDGDARLRRKTVVLPSAVDTSRFRPEGYGLPERQRIRQELGVSAECVLVGSVGNINRFKGYTYLVEAAAAIKKQMPAARFLIVGRPLDTDPGYWEQLQELAARLGLTEDFFYPGFRDDIPAVLSALDVFVLPSVRESCPMAILEAMAMQVPVVATDVGAAAELVLDGQTGLVVPPGNPEALAGAVLACLKKSPAEVRAMVEAARKRVESRFAVDIIARRQLQVYESLRRCGDQCRPHPHESAAVRSNEQP